MELSKRCQLEQNERQICVPQVEIS